MISLRFADNQPEVRRRWAPPGDGDGDHNVDAALYALSLDLLLARRLLAHLDHGVAGRSEVHSASFCRSQLRLQAFTAPPSWSQPASGDGDDEARPDPCAVCLEHVAPGERCVSGPACLHRLHEACALQLVAHSGPLVCPSCRSPLLAVDCRAPGEAAGGDASSDCGDEDAPPSNALWQRAVAPDDMAYLHALLAQAAQSAGRRLLWRSMHGGVGGVVFGDSDSDHDMVEEHALAEERAAHLRAAGGGRSLLRRLFCARPAEEPAASQPDSSAAALGAAASPADDPRRDAPAPQCGCSVM